jgi:Fe-S oxidoreductase
VVVVQDAFTSHYDAAVVADFCELLQRLGFRPWLSPYLPNGKPQHVLGMLTQFQRVAKQQSKTLNALAACGVDLVGVDPSMTLTFRAEYVKALGLQEAPRVLLAQEWLAQRLDDLPQLPSEPGPGWRLMPHCTERTNAPAATTEWQRVAQRLGVKLEVVASGCCGMAGLYGHELAHRETSEAIYRLSWGPILADPDVRSRTSATGYSCRCQVKLMDGIRLKHPIQVLLESIQRKAD